MSSSKYEISPIAKRIIGLSASYATDKAFLNECEITNLSFITDLKKGRTKMPGADKLAQIVRGTGCSGTWLLTGVGEKYPSVRPETGMAASPRETYISDVMQARHLIERLEQKADEMKDDEQLDNLALQASQLITAILELRQKTHTGSDSS